MHIRNVRSEDAALIMAMNDAEIPAVPALPSPMFDLFESSATAFRVAVRAGEVAGFVVALGPDVPYDSLNYRWFCQRPDEVLYVDRLVVSPAHRRRGFASALYDDLARAHYFAAIGCEVNLDPPNPGSVAFHRRMGFVEVGRQVAGGKLVSLLQADCVTVSSP